MTREKLINLSKQLIADKENYLVSFHKNMDMYVSQPDMTIREISERSGLSFSTINTVLYGSNKDYKLSTIIGLSKAMNVSVDELVGCSTLTDEERYLIQEYRSSSPQIQSLLLWFIHLQQQIHIQTQSYMTQTLTIMTLQTDIDGSLLPSNQYHCVQIADQDAKALQHVFLGLQLPCCTYMPYYSPYDYILLANDRLPKINEDSVILSSGKLYLARRIQTAKPDELQFKQLNSSYILVPAVDEIMGYIVDVRIDESYYQR